MNYELAKQLKDAGFPQKQNPRYETWNGNEHGEPCTVPTLEELIEACGDRLHYLKQISGHWFAMINDLHNDNIDGQSDTPTEAVARLWLALNKKESGIV